MRRASGIVSVLGLFSLASLASFTGCASSTPEQRPVAAPEPAPVEPQATVTPEQNDAIDAVFRRKAPELQDCWTVNYQKTHDRKVEGDLTIGMNIQPSGAPADVRVLKSSLGNADIESCVIKQVSGWSFAEGTAPVPYMRTVHLGPQF